MVNLSKIIVILHKLAYGLHKKNIYQSPWITYVKSSLDRIGLSDNWLSQTVNNIYAFKTRVKSVLHDNFTQSWKSKIFESSKCINHRIYKDTFKFEGYLNLLPFRLAKVMCKFRCSDHKLPIEQGRFFWNRQKSARLYPL